jgi:beta-glucosidase
VFKRILKIVKYFSLSLLLVVTILCANTAFYIYQESRLDHRIADNQFEAVQSLVSNGIRYRDLNRNGRMDNYENPELPTDSRVDDLLNQMSTAEKVGLMFHTITDIGPGGSLSEPPEISDSPVINAFYSVAMRGNILRSLVVRHINHYNVINSIPAKDMIRWHNRVQRKAEQTRLGIPVTFSTDPRHSFRDAPAATSLASVNMSQWPDALGLAALDNVEVTEQFARIANQEYRALGFRIALHPMADLATEPRWGRNVGTFGEDAELSSRHIRAYIRGFQGEQINHNSVLSVTKHYPGGGAQDDGHESHFSHGRNHAYPGNNFEYLLKPFEAAFEAGTAQIMTAYGVPVGQTDEEVAVSFNRWILTDLLRERYGFDGVVLADWQVITPKGAWHDIGFIPARAWGVEHLSIEDRFAKALEAGVDQFGGESHPEPLVRLVEQGKVKEQRIDASARRILRDKFRLGLFDNPYIYSADLDQHLQLSDSIEAGKKAQRESQVLLLNRDTPKAIPILPLQLGTRIYVEGVPKAVAAQYGEVVNTVDEADVAILRIKAPARAPQLRSSIQDSMFELFFRQGDLDFNSEELLRLQQIMQKKPTVVSMYMDRPAVIPTLAQEASALLANFGVTDDAVMDVLFGKSSPKGRLPFELPSSMTAVREQMEDVPYDSHAPLFEFGFGLSYQ